MPPPVSRETQHLHRLKEMLKREYEYGEEKEFETLLVKLHPVWLQHGLELAHIKLLERLRARMFLVIDFHDKPELVHEEQAKLVGPDPIYTQREGFMRVVELCAKVGRHKPSWRWHDGPGPQSRYIQGGGMHPR